MFVLEMPTNAFAGIGTSHLLCRWPGFADGYVGSPTVSTGELWKEHNCWPFRARSELGGTFSDRKRNRAKSSWASDLQSTSCRVGAWVSHVLEAPWRPLPLYSISAPLWAHSSHFRGTLPFDPLFSGELNSLAFPGPVLLWALHWFCILLAAVVFLTAQPGSAGGAYFDKSGVWYL